MKAKRFELIDLEGRQIVHYSGEPMPIQVLEQDDGDTVKVCVGGLVFKGAIDTQLRRIAKLEASNRERGKTIHRLESINSSGQWYDGVAHGRRISADEKLDLLEKIRKQRKDLQFANLLSLWLGLALIAVGLVLMAVLP